MKPPQISFGKSRIKTPLIGFGGTARVTDAFGVENAGLGMGYLTDEQCLAVFRKVNHREVARQRPSMINPMNADFVRKHIPTKGRTSFLLLNGNCQGIDLIMAIVKALPSPPEEMILSSLSANMDTFEQLDTIRCRKEILISSYFLATNPDNIIGKLWQAGKLRNYDIGIWRNHTKHILIRAGDLWIFAAGSANFRSSGCIESMFIVNDQRLYSFNRKWMRHLIAREPVGRYLKEGRTNANGFFTFLDQDRVNIFHHAAQ